MFKSGYWTNKAPYRRIRTETLSYDPYLAFHVRWYARFCLVLWPVVVVVVDSGVLLE
jgi:hypothetical protein